MQNVLSGRLLQDLLISSKISYRRKLLEVIPARPLLPEIFRESSEQRKYCVSEPNNFNMPFQSRQI